MTKAELKEIIKKIVLDEMVNIPSAHKSINDKLMQIAKREKKDENEDNQQK
jgi:hypothetical protein